MDKNIRIGVVDDHTLFRRGMVSLVEGLSEDYRVLFEAVNGKDCLVKIGTEGVPDILMMDVSMPVMDGYALAETLRRQYPSLPILVVSMIDREEALIRMLRLGIRGYLSKDIEPDELKIAIESVLNKGYYYTDHVTGKLIHVLQGGSDTARHHSLSERELQFIRMACSEDTYKEIADKMHLSVKTVDTYRMNVFEKLNIKSRTGLVLYAVREGLMGEGFGI